MILSEFTTTAMCRPDILNRTYESFSKNLIGIDFKKCTLYLNIDPAPKIEYMEEVISVANKYFGEVVINTPEICNFCSAVRWCFSRPKGKLFFHLEDDWILLKPVDVGALEKMLERKNEESKKVNEKYVSVALRAYPKDSNKIVLAPSIFYSSFSKDISEKLDIRFNPEEQLREHPKRGGVRKTGVNEFSLRYPQTVEDVVIKDIGREWIRENNIIGNRMRGFIRWKKW